MAGDGEPDVRRRAKRDGRAAHLRPRCAVARRVAFDECTGAYESHPLWRRDAWTLTRHADVARGRPVLERRPPAARDKGDSVRRIRVERSPDHDTRLGPVTGRKQRIHSRSDVDVARNWLVDEEEVVGCIPDVRAAAVDGEGVLVEREAACRNGATDVLSRPRSRERRGTN